MQDMINLQAGSSAAWDAARRATDKGLTGYGDVYAAALKAAQKAYNENPWPPAAYSPKEMADRAALWNIKWVLSE